MNAYLKELRRKLFRGRRRSRPPFRGAQEMLVVADCAADSNLDLCRVADVVLIRVLRVKVVVRCEGIGKLAVLMLVDRGRSQFARLLCRWAHVRQKP